MARVTQIELDSVMIEGTYDTLYVLRAIDADSNLAWQVMDTFGTQYGGFIIDRDVAVQNACIIADSPDDLNQ